MYFSVHCILTQLTTLSPPLNHSFFLPPPLSLYVSLSTFLSCSLSLTHTLSLVYKGFQLLPLSLFPSMLGTVCTVQATGMDMVEYCRILKSYSICRLQYAGYQRLGGNFFIRVCPPTPVPHTHIPFPCQHFQGDIIPPVKYSTG